VVPSSTVFPAPKNRSCHRTFRLPPRCVISPSPPVRTFLFKPHKKPEHGPPNLSSLLESLPAPRSYFPLVSLPFSWAQGEDPRVRLQVPRFAFSFSPTLFAVTFFVLLRVPPADYKQNLSGTDNAVFITPRGFPPPDLFFPRPPVGSFPPTSNTRAPLSLRKDGFRDTGTDSAFFYSRVFSSFSPRLSFGVFSSLSFSPSLFLFRDSAPPLVSWSSPRGVV